MLPFLQHLLKTTLIHTEIRTIVLPATINHPQVDVSDALEVLHQHRTLIHLNPEVEDVQLVYCQFPDPKDLPYPDFNDRAAIYEGARTEFSVTEANTFLYRTQRNILTCSFVDTVNGVDITVLNPGPGCLLESNWRIIQSDEGFVPGRTAVHMQETAIVSCNRLLVPLYRYKISQRLSTIRDALSRELVRTMLVKNKGGRVLEEKADHTWSVLRQSALASQASLQMQQFTV